MKKYYEKTKNKVRWNFHVGWGRTCVCVRLFRWPSNENVKFEELVARGRTITHKLVEGFTVSRHIISEHYVCESKKCLKADGHYPCVCIHECSSMHVCAKN